MKQPKLKIGQKYRVNSPTWSVEKYRDKIVTVHRITLEDQFRNEEGDLFDIKLDKLQLITPKTKKVKKWKYSIESLDNSIDLIIGHLKYYSEKELKEDLVNFKKDLLATQTQPIKEDRKECKHKFPNNFENCVLCGISIYKTDY